MAWRSTCGFQSESKRSTISAVAKLIPRPPALVLNMKTNFSLPGKLKLSMDTWNEGCIESYKFVIDQPYFNDNTAQDKCVWEG